MVYKVARGKLGAYDVGHRVIATRRTRPPVGNGHPQGEAERDKRGYQEQEPAVGRTSSPQNSPDAREQSTGHFTAFPRCYAPANDPYTRDLSPPIVAGARIPQRRMA